MTLYTRKILPRAIDLACSLEAVRVQRARLIPAAAGRVLEIGAGSGLNFPFYNSEKLSDLIALEPAAEMRRLAAARTGDVAVPITFLDASAEEIPLESGSVDTVVLTYSLCSIGDPAAALFEMRRVLKPRGRLLFSEHGLAPDVAVRRWQNLLNPLWKRLAGGCHLNRDIPRLIRGGGFCIDEIDAAYLSGPKPMTFNYLGSARPQ